MRGSGWVHARLVLKTRVRLVAGARMRRAMGAGAARLVNLVVRGS